MNEDEMKTKREKLRKGIKVSSIAQKLVLNSLDEIDDFNDFMKSAIKRAQSLTSKRLEKGARGLEGEELDRYLDFFAEDYQKIGSVFEKLALDSFVVMLYSLVETGMATLCETLRQDREKDKGEKISLRYSDLRGNGYLGQTKIYIEKVLGFDLDLRNNVQWPEIKALRELRNTIVHEQGFLNTKNVRFKNYIKQGFLELKNQNEENGQISGRVIISAAYIDYILPQIRTFFQNFKI